MTRPSVDDLMAAESRLNQSLIACVGAVLAGFAWSLLAVKSGSSGTPATGLVALLLLLLQIGCYGWFAASAGRAARILGEGAWKYVVWILVAPFLALVPIPIVSTLIGVSPLSIKFLLGGQLQRAIRETPFAD